MPAVFHMNKAPAATSDGASWPYSAANHEAIMNKSLLTIIAALAVAFSSVPSRAGDNSIYKVMTCFHGHPRHSDGCSLPDMGRRYRSLEECARTAEALNGNNRMDRHISYKCIRKPD